MIKVKNDKKKSKLSEADIRQNERIAKQIKLQCVNCGWWDKGAFNTPGNAMCTYYIKNGIGHRVDHGKGVGDCRMFKLKTIVDEKERIEYRKQRLLYSELENYALKVGE